MRRLRVFLAYAVVLGGSGCGGDNPSAPSEPTADFPQGTVLFFASGETDQPVAGATVTINGRTYTADPAGEVRLDADTRTQTPLEVAAPGFLDRQTRLRSRSETRFTLWPSFSPTGLDQDLTAALVYGLGDCSGEPGGTLRRFAREISRIFIEIDPDSSSAPWPLGYKDNQYGQRQMEKAAREMELLLDGRIDFDFGTSAPGGVAVIKVLEHRSDVPPGAAAIAILEGDRQGYTLGGEIHFAGPAFGHRAGASPFEKGSVFVMLHELGHFAGFGHHSGRGVMAACPAGEQAGLYSFTPAERLAAHLMHQRRAYNRYPDNDQDVQAMSLQPSSVVVECFGGVGI